MIRSCVEVQFTDWGPRAEERNCASCTILRYPWSKRRIFFFQAEDGIRDLTVTGVQTCALPICSGTTILVALILGLTRPAATEFSFLVSIPTMLAAGGWKIFKSLHHAPGTAPEHWGMVSLGTIAAAVGSFMAVKWFLRYVQSHTFEGFGWYRIAVGILILVFLR